jgi:hypothetical protein
VFYPGPSPIKIVEFYLQPIPQKKAEIVEGFRQIGLWGRGTAKNRIKLQKKRKKFEKNSDLELSGPGSPKFYVQLPTKKIRETPQVSSSILTPNMPEQSWHLRSMGPKV